MRRTSYYGDVIESIVVEHDGDVAEFIYVDRGQVGIRLNGKLRYFYVRGINKGDIYCTRTGISCWYGTHPMWYVSGHTDDDAMWLARQAFGVVTKPKKSHPWTNEFAELHPELCMEPTA